MQIVLTRTKAHSPAQRVGGRSQVVIRRKRSRILVFDLETHNKDFADPKWTPYEIIGIGWSWYASGIIESVVMPESLPDALEYFRTFYDKADMVVGHNLPGFDLPTVNGAMEYFNLPRLAPKMCHDTYAHRMKVRGIRKSLEKTAKRLGIEAQKGKPDWDVAWSLYTPHPEIRAIVDPYMRGDVLLSDEVYRRMLARGYMNKPREWTP